MHRSSKWSLSFGFPHQNPRFNSILPHTCPNSAHHRIHTKWILPHSLLEHNEWHIMSYYLCAGKMCARLLPYQVFINNYLNHTLSVTPSKLKTSLNTGKELTFYYGTSCTAKNGKIISVDRLSRTWKLSLPEVVTRHLNGGTDNHRKPQDSQCPSKISTSHLPHTSLNHYNLSQLTHTEDGNREREGESTSVSFTL